MYKMMPSYTDRLWKAMYSATFYFLIIYNFEYKYE